MPQQGDLAADLAIRRDRRRPGRMGGAARRSASPRWFRSAIRSTSISAICSTYFALDRGTRAILLYVEFDQGRAQVHVGGAGGGAGEAGGRGQGRPPRAGRQGGRDPYRRARRIRRRLRRRVPPRRPVARARPRRAVRRRRDARAPASRFPASGSRSSPMAAASACSRSTGSSISAARSPRFRRTTMARLDAALPPTWSKANPVDIVGDADAARYAAALEALLADPENDAVLVMNVPTALASPTATARCRRVASRARIAASDGPAQAGARGLGRRRRRRRSSVRSGRHSGLRRPKPTRCAASCISCAIGEARDALMETPPSLPAGFRARRRRRARRSSTALREGRALARSARGGRACWRPMRSRSRRPCLRATPTRRPRRPAVPRRGHAGGRQDPVAGHRAQVRRRRRAAEPRHRSDAVREADDRDILRRARCRNARRAHHTASPSTR